MSHVVADLSDAHPHCPVLEPGLHEYGGHARFFGQIRTVKVFEDNALVRAELETPGHGAVLVVDGGGSKRCALVGGLLGELAVQNGWSGIVVWGCVRDSVELRGQPLGVRALACHPKKSAKGAHGGQRNVPLHFAGVSFHPGHWLYADEDGILLSAQPLHG